MSEIERLRAALEKALEHLEADRDKYGAFQSVHHKIAWEIVTKALSQSPTEPGGAERVREKMKSLFEAWDLRGICEERLEGYEQGVLLELIEMCEEIAGINAPEKV